MTKCAVIHLTRFYQSLRNDFPYLKCTKAISHYKALYWFRQGQYDLVLKLCEDILEEENVNHPEYSDFVENTDPLIEYRILPSLFFPFLDLYDSDVGVLVWIDVLDQHTLLLSPNVLQGWTHHEPWSNIRSASDQSELHCKIFENSMCNEMQAIQDRFTRNTHPSTFREAFSRAGLDYVYNN